MASHSTPRTVIAIDWSGAEAKAAQRRAICSAMCEVGGPESASAVESLQLKQGLLRSEIEHWLLNLAAAAGDRPAQASMPVQLAGRMQTPAAVVVGLDFSFSLPAWFLQELGGASAPELWRMTSEQGERWLREPHRQFWGRRKGSGPPGEHRAPLWRGYRECERAVLGNRLPLSSFQIGGAGAVGTGTVRGLPMLARLQAAGWSVWPFDPPRTPMLVEIYPRSLTGPVVKSSAAARAAYLARPRFAGLTPLIRQQAEASEDAFDALVSALSMQEHAAEFGRLEQAKDPIALLEGEIWRPGIA